MSLATFDLKDFRRRFINAVSDFNFGILKIQNYEEFVYVNDEEPQAWKSVLDSIMIGLLSQGSETYYCEHYYFAAKSIGGKIVIEKNIVHNKMNGTKNVNLCLLQIIGKIIYRYHFATIVNHHFYSGVLLKTIYSNKKSYAELFINHDIELKIMTTQEYDAMTLNDETYIIYV